MDGPKASLLAERCAETNRAFLRFDYSGHGQSSGRFTDGTIGQWKQDALDIFDRLTEGPQILVGSSMGGWIVLMMAVERPQRVRGVVGIAAAPDFTEDLMWARMTPEQQEALMRDGVYQEPSQYQADPLPITRQLIEEGRNHLMLRGPIAYQGPVRLIQGCKDPDVPMNWPDKIEKQLDSMVVQTLLIPDGDHRLNRPHDLDLMWGEITEVIDWLKTGAPLN
jgi:pimeloyl-ACP methyl ester carboxylesterase